MPWAGPGTGLIAWSQTLPRNPAAAGLWVGEVTINQVLHVAGGTNAPVTDTAQLRLIVHIDASGVPHLLKDVVLARKATSRETPAEIAVVILSDPARLPSIPGLARPNGRLMAQRIATAAFDFSGNSLALEGGIGEGFRCRGTVSLSDIHPGNPFLHRLHPEHSQGIPIDRAIELSFTVPAGNVNGVSRLAGQYDETITGLHKAPLHIRGSVVLNRISPVAVLN